MGAFDLYLNAPQTLYSPLAFLGGVGQARQQAGAQQASLDQQANMAQSQAWGNAIQQGFQAIRPLALAPFANRLAGLEPAQQMIAGNLLGLPGLTQYGGIQAHTDADFQRDYGMTPSQIQNLGAESYQNAPPMVQEQIAGQLGYTPAQVEGLGTSDRNAFNRAAGLGIVRQGQAEVAMQNRAQMAGMIEQEQIRANDNMARVASVAAGDAVLGGSYGSDLAALQGRMEEIQSADNLTPQQRNSLMRQNMQEQADLIARTPANQFITTKQPTPQEQFQGSLVTLKDPVTGKEKVYQPVRGAKGGITKYEPLDKEGGPNDKVFTSPQERDASFDLNIKRQKNPVTGQEEVWSYKNGDWHLEKQPGAGKDEFDFSAVLAADLKTQQDQMKFKEVGAVDVNAAVLRTMEAKKKYDEAMALDARYTEYKPVIDFLKGLPPEELGKIGVNPDFATQPRDEQHKTVEKGLLQLQQEMTRRQMKQAQQGAAMPAQSPQQQPPMAGQSTAPIIPQTPVLKQRAPTPHPLAVQAAAEELDAIKKQYPNVDDMPTEVYQRAMTLKEIKNAGR